MKKDKIYIIDYGSQYTRLIAKKLTNINIENSIIAPDQVNSIKNSTNLAGIILSGGPSAVYNKEAVFVSDWIFENTEQVPVLGICYGLQLIAYRFGKLDDVVETDKREYGKSSLYIEGQSKLFENVSNGSQVWMSHGDKLAAIPEGFTVIGKSINSEYAAISNNNGIYGLQFHPEVDNTHFGQVILHNFAKIICKIGGYKETNFSISEPTDKDTFENAYITEIIEKIKKQIGDNKTICALSGGVDSTVAAVLVHRAIGDNLECVFINNGLLRLDEENRVKKTLTDNLNLNVIYIDCSERFFNALNGVTDPEEKRKIIGKIFIDEFSEYAEKHGVKYLVQGTLYPDVIESKPKNSHAHLIKTHHNVGGLPDDLDLELVEPLRLLYKDQVRMIGRKLKIQDKILNRQPFPGPGLAVRVIGSVSKGRIKILRAADAIVQQEIKQAGIYNKLWQCFALLLNTKSVGVVGDQRRYNYVVAIRAVVSNDAMTASWAKIPYEILEVISSRIVNEIEQVSRVVYDITNKPPGTIEWE